MTTLLSELSPGHRTSNGVAGSDLPHLGHGILDQPLIGFGPEIVADLPGALRREWLVTNGLGGYASGTLAGVNTRRYHGLLVAALAPPVERTLLVAGSIDWVTYDGRWYPLSTHEYGDGTIDPHGSRHMASFTLDGNLPVWTYAIADALLERRVWMAHGATTTYVMYRVLRGSLDLELDVSPLVTYRGFHSLNRGEGWRPATLDIDGGVEVRAFDGALPYPLIDGARAASAIDAVGRALLTPLGLRSLGPDDADYRGDYVGGPGRRDSGYHQGPVWTWLLGPYAEAHYRVHNARSASLALLRPVEHHLRDACLGSVSEILEGDPPHRPVGCVARAWGVAETLRVWRALSQTGAMP